jgi:hypothetical protein
VRTRKFLARGMLVASLLAIIAILTAKPNGHQNLAYATGTQTATQTPIITPTQTATPAATPIAASAPTPVTVYAAAGGCPAQLALLLAPRIGLDWCQDTSVSPPVLYVYNGYSFVRASSLLKGVTPPSSANNNSLWMNTNDVPPVLEECSAATCPGQACTATCGTWTPLEFPNYGPLPSPIP